MPHDDEAFRQFQRERIEAAKKYDAEQAKRSAGLVPTLTPYRALILLFRENAIPMSDRNSYLFTLIGDALTPAPNAGVGAISSGSPTQSRKE